jgi:hypothetical protein
MRKDGPNGPDKHQKEVVAQRWEAAALKRFDPRIGILQGLELEPSGPQEEREQPKVRSCAERTLSRERRLPEAVVRELEVWRPRRQADCVEGQRRCCRGHT